MKITMFTDTYEPQINGVVTSIKSYSKELRRRGHEVHIFCPHAKGLRKSKHVHSIRSIDFKPYPSYKIGIPTPSVIRKIKKINPDIVHVHSPASVGILGLSAGKLLRKPIIMTYHTALTEYVSYLPGTRFKKIENAGKKTIEKYVRLFFGRADVIIAPGKDTKKFLERLIKNKPIIVLPTGITQPKKISKKRKNKIPIILQVGRLCKERSVDVILKAFSEVLKNEKAKLIITSGGPAEDELKNLAKNLGIEKNVLFTGFISERMKNKLYNNANIFVSASTTDTQGLTVLEAMSFGTPVIVPDAPGFRDFVRNRKNGLIFSPGNVKQLSRLMCKLITNERLSTRLSLGSLETARKFDIKVIVDKLESIYNFLYRTYYLN